MLKLIPLVVAFFSVLIFVHFSAHADGVPPALKGTCSLVSQNAPPAWASRFADQSRDERLLQLRTFLAKDQTNAHPYVHSHDQSQWFVCQHFSMQLFLRGSAYVKPEDFTELETSTPITFSNDSLPAEQRLPLLYVALANEPAGVFHAINAVYLGANPKGSTDLSDYVFIEPQTDEIYFTLQALWDSYLPGVHTPTQIYLGIAGHLDHASDQGIQYLTQSWYQFSCDYPY